MSKNKTKNKDIFLFGFIPLIIIFAGISFFIGPKIFTVNYDVASQNKPLDIDSSNILQNSNEENILEQTHSPEKIKYIKTPEIVKSIYMTACVAGTPGFRQNLIDLAKETEINSIIIDIKDFSGTISFKTDNPKLLGVNGTGCRASDMADLIKELHKNGIYVIGRVTVFQDPYYTKIRPDLAVKKSSDGSVWRDYKGISFIDVGAKEYWDYVIELSIESHKIGFDEINFDYVRFPSDGNMKDIHFPFSEKVISENGKFGKAIVLENFFKYLYEEISKYNKNLENPMMTSVDLFGMVTTSTDDLNIGQVLERALPYFDYIVPMVYPSHYPPHFNGWSDPNKYPYELIYFVMKSAVERVENFKNNLEISEKIRERVSVEQLRTWIQDFNYGGTYGPNEIRAQIDASVDAGVKSWMIWSPSNRYTRGALE
ncbi:MAG TPA: putative glycoside hydrolase [Candidatus Paceibacterota bacterium]|nr:putative glycoside hydrolase [Candidatus Paceibacterota bacterium]